MKVYRVEDVKFKDVVLLDVRTKEEWEYVHIKGALHIPLDELEDRFNELDKKKEIVVFCHHGGRALMAARFLSSKGFNAGYMEGGIDEWALKIDKSLKRY